jgi:hypothetical protein
MLRSLQHHWMVNSSSGSFLFVAMLSSYHGKLRQVALAVVIK